MYNLNQKLSEIKSGNYLIKVTSIGDKRPNKYYSKEYFVTVKYQVTDLNNPKRKYGVIVPFMGAKPIELNVDRELLPTNFFLWENFDEVSAHELSHLFGFVFKMCVLKRDYVRIGYYSKVFGGTE